MLAHKKILYKHFNIYFPKVLYCPKVARFDNMSIEKEKIKLCDINQIL